MSGGLDVAAGPLRWKRAIENATARPTSHGAKLYEWRLGVAQEVERRLYFADALVLDGAFTVITGRRGERRAHLCSRRCVTLHLQLTCADECTVEEYVNALDHAEADDVVELSSTKYVTCEVTNLKATNFVACRVCGDHIDPNNSTRAAVPPLIPTIEEKPTLEQLVHEDTKQYVLVDGYLKLLADVIVVDLTLADLHVLTRYSTSSLRAEFVQNRGHKIGVTP